MGHLQLAGLELWLTLPKRRCRSSVRIGLFSGLLGFCHFPELLVDLAGSFADSGELVGLGERLADDLAGVSDLAAGVLSVGGRSRLVFLQPVKAVL
jgi:hypothetical protein